MLNVADQSALASNFDLLGHAPRDGQRHEFGLPGEFDFGLRQIVGVAADVLPAQQPIAHRPGKHHRPAEQSAQQVRIFFEQRRRESSQIATVIDDPAPQLATLPKPVVTGVGAKHEQQSEHGSNQRVSVQRNRKRVLLSQQPVEGCWVNFETAVGKRFDSRFGVSKLMPRDDDRRPDDADCDASKDLAQHRAFDVEQVTAPVMRVVLDHALVGQPFQADPIYG